MTKTVPTAIIQARMGSSRLSNKSLRLLGGKPLLEWVISGTQKMKNIRQVVLATTTLKEDDALCRLAEEMGILCIRGSAEDVLARYRQAAEETHADPIVRVCADSPIVAAEDMDAMVQAHIEAGADFTHNVSVAPLGPFGGIISRAALQRMHAEADSPHQREHVIPYLLEHPEMFAIRHYELSDGYDTAYRMTIDEPKDLEMMETLVAAIRDAGLEPTLAHAVAVLRQHPEIAAINADVQQVKPKGTD